MSFHRKPVLVALDFQQRTARRYVPKAIGGFFREEAIIGQEGEPLIGFGGEDGLAMIERFRTGNMALQSRSVDEDVAA